MRRQIGHRVAGASPNLTSSSVDAVLDHGAAEQARLVHAERARLLASGSAVTVEMMAKALGKQPASVRKWIERQRGRGRLITVSHGGQILVPTFQLDLSFELDPDVAELVQRLLAHRMEPWAIWRWFESPNTWLDGATPRATLGAGELRAVRRAVAGMFQE